MVGTPASVTVIADDNLLNNVVTTVSGTRLTVGMSGSTSTRTTVRVDIVAPSLTAIHAGSAATVDVQGLTAHQGCDWRPIGRAVIAAGTAPTMNFFVGRRAGQLRLDDLSVDRATVSIDSAGHALAQRRPGSHRLGDFGGNADARREAGHRQRGDRPHGECRPAVTGRSLVPIRRCRPVPWQLRLAVSATGQRHSTGSKMPFRLTVRGPTRPPSRLRSSRCPS